jgi:hypothetical protein
MTDTPSMPPLDGITVERCVQVIIDVALAPRRFRGDKEADASQIAYEIAMSNAGYFMLEGLGLNREEIIALMGDRR